EGHGWAANAASGQGHMVYGPWFTGTSTGDHVAAWRILIDDNSGPNDYIATVEVYDATAGESLGYAPLFRNQWNASNAYQTFEVPFSWSSGRAGHLLNLLVWHSAAAYVRVDKVGIR